MLEEGSLPIRQAFDDEAALDEERRLLYVGITRARVHLALSWAERRDARGGGSGPRRGAAAEPVPRGPGAIGSATALRGRGAGVPTGPRSRRVPMEPRGRATPMPDTPVMAALREWRSRRARGRRRAGVRRRPRRDAAARSPTPGRTSLAALRRVKGMGPTKLERYGAEILAAIASVDVTRPRTSPGPRS